jgi:hypothetical protein
VTFQWVMNRIAFPCMWTCSGWKKNGRNLSKYDRFCSYEEQ